MSRPRLLSARATRVTVLVLAAMAAAAVACDDTGEPLPARCTDPPLELYDFANAEPIEGGAAADDVHPCVTPVGHAISETGDQNTAGSSSGGTTSAAGAPSAGGADGADAGAGGI